MKKGKVKFFDQSKGFGFIVSDENNEEVFVHATGLAQGQRINENDSVTFELRQGKKGMNAVNVEKVS